MVGTKKPTKHSFTDYVIVSLGLYVTPAVLK